MVRLTTVVLMVSVALSSAAARQTARAGSLTDVSGVWTMLVEGHQIGLELEQKDGKVEGVMLAMGRRVLLVGTYEGRALTLRGERPEDGAGFSHGGDGQGGGSGPGPIVATMKDDGTLDGELSTNRGRTKWTGERLAPR